MSARAKWLILFCVTAAVILSEILLVQQNLALRAALERRTHPALEAGEKVPSFTAPDLNGKQIKVDFPHPFGRDRILFYLSAHCPYTDIQLPYWCRMMERADPKRFEFVGIVDRSEEVVDVLSYLALRPCDLSQRVLRLDGELAEKYRLSITPTTLLISSDGTVARVWSGLWNRDDVEEAFERVGAAAALNSTAPEKPATRQEP